MAYSVDAANDNCYPNTTVLINKLGLKTQEALDEAEKIAVSLHSVEIEQNSSGEPLDFAYYCTLHKRLFEDLYDWAGELRTINLSKKGTHFYPTNELKSLGTAMFQRLQAAHEFCGLPHTAFVSEITEFYNDVNLLHPFREGNGRTQRLFFTLLIRRAGYCIQFADCDTDALMMATIYAAQGISDYLLNFFDKAICEISEKPSPFYDERNHARLLKSARQMEQSGGTVHSLVEENGTHQQN
jgi:cell filamentation protein